MSVLELEKAIAELPSEEPSKFASWFEEFMADEWNQQIERDVSDGKFDQLIVRVEKVGHEWSARIGMHIARWLAGAAMSFIGFGIGHHSEYDKFLS